MAVPRPITLDELTTALKNTLGKKGMKPENVERLAEYVMNFFGFNDFVVDNLLNAKDRDVFYMLEEEGILTTLREEVTIQKGKVWRIHYWVFRRDTIEKLVRPAEPRVRKKRKEYPIYELLPEEDWQRHIEELS